MKISPAVKPTAPRNSPVDSGETISLLVDAVELGRPSLPERPGFIRILVDRPGGALLPPYIPPKQMLANQVWQSNATCSSTAVEPQPCEEKVGQQLPESPDWRVPGQ